MLFLFCHKNLVDPKRQMGSKLTEDPGMPLSGLPAHWACLCKQNKQANLFPLRVSQHVLHEAERETAHVVYQHHVLEDSTSPEQAGSHGKGPRHTRTQRFRSASVWGHRWACWGCLDAILTADCYNSSCHHQLADWASCSQH